MYSLCLLFIRETFKLGGMVVTIIIATPWVHAISDATPLFPPTFLKYAGRGIGYTK